MEDLKREDIQLAFSFSDEDFMAFLPKSEEEQFTTRWSDFNFHDPGVTAYEAMQLSFENFFYRYDFPIQDLMQGLSHSAFDDWGIDDLYTTYAVTEDDYRRILATSKYIENVAVTPVMKGNVNPNTEDLICLLDVDVAADIPIFDNSLIQSWERALIKNRAIGEYFNRQKGQKNFIRDKKKRVKIETKVALHPVGDDQFYFRKIFDALQDYLLPNLGSIDYRTIGKQHQDLSKLFTGPHTNSDHQKNVVDESFDKPAYRRFIIVSELFEVIEQLSFVRKVSFVRVALDGKYESSILDLEEFTFTELGELHINRKTLYENLYIQPIIPIIRMGETADLRVSTPNFVDELVIDGRFRDLSSSVSLQTSFPPNYEMGKYLMDQDNEELIKTSSFRAFLYFMDQIRANISGQMGDFHRIFSITKELPSFVEADISDKLDYVKIDIPDLSKPLKSDKKDSRRYQTLHAYKADDLEIQNRFTEQRLNYLLALNGWGVGADASTFWNRKEYTQIKNDFLNLVHQNSDKSCPINSELNYCFQCNSLILLQEKLRVILQFDVDAVRILEHFFLQPVWEGERGLNFELTVFLFEKEHPEHINREYKNYVERMIRAMIPAHIVEMVKWIPYHKKQEVSNKPPLTPELFDCHLAAAIPPGKIFYLNSEISEHQRKAMNWLVECL